MLPDVESIRDRVRDVYSSVARAPEGLHPFRVGRKLAERAGYSSAWLSSVPEASVESFAGVSCVPCFAEVVRSDRVLDLGCGAGLDSLLTAGTAASVLGIDFSNEMVERASTSAAQMQLSNVSFKVADAERMPVGDATVDVVLVNGIFNLNPSRQELFTELARVVRPGGLVFAAELILKGPLPPDVIPSEGDWFS
jgi:arsenite methyltransferase